GGTGAGKAEGGLLVAHVAAACARGTSRRRLPRRRSAAPALVARFIAAHLDFGLLAEGGLFEGQRQVAAGVTAALRPAAPASAAHVHAEKVAEDIAEDIAEIGEVGRIEAAEAAAVQAGMSVLVIASALVRVHQHTVRLGALLELLFRLAVPRIAVGMVLHRQLAVGALDLLVGGRAGHAQDFVVVTFCLCCQNGPLLETNVAGSPLLVQILKPPEHIIQFVTPGAGELVIGVANKSVARPVIPASLFAIGKNAIGRRNGSHFFYIAAVAWFTACFECRRQFFERA